jgi:hypothetical protein
MGIDNRFGKDAAVQRVALADDSVTDHNDRSMPSTFGQWFPPLAQSFPFVERHVDTCKLGFEGVLDHIFG